MNTKARLSRFVAHWNYDFSLKHNPPSDEDRVLANRYRLIEMVLRFGGMAIAAGLVITLIIITFAK